LTFTVTDSLINHDEIEGGVVVASPRKGKICLDSKMSCFLFCFGKLMVYLILLCNDRHLWLKPSRKRRLPRNPPRGPKMVTFQVMSITKSGAGFSCWHYVKLVKKLSPERFDSLATTQYHRSYRDWRWRWRYLCEHCCVPILLKLYIYLETPCLDWNSPFVFF